MSYYSRNTVPRHTPPPPPNPRRDKRRGLGDLVEAFTQATGIKKMMEHRAAKKGKDCGCNKRKESMNKLTDKVLRR